MIRVSWPACLSAPESCATPILRPSGQSKFGQMNWIFMRSSGRGGDGIRDCSTGLSECSVSLENDWNCPQKNRHVLAKRMSLHVRDVVLVGLEKREGPAPHDLCETRDSGLHVELTEVFWRIVTDVLEDVWPGAHDRHVALQDADKIR